jgi:hypothetical protein
MPHYMISDFGGITNSTEGLIRGYEALGHEVTLMLMEYREFNSSNATEFAPDSEDSTSASGIAMGQRVGYRFPPQNRYGYKNATKKFQKFANGFDLVHWQVPVPTQTKENKGNNQWPDLYDLKVPQIAHSHDGNIQKTPWISVVADQWKGLGCVHSCALKGAARVMDIPKSMVPSPQWDIEQRMEGGLIGRERFGWLSLQTFKAWKRVDDLVRAVPFMKHEGPRTLAGGGIERYYMTSEDKMKPIYTWRQGDKDFKNSFRDHSIWSAASLCGMKYLDFIGNDQRDKLLRKRTALIDPSWSDTYAFYGAHINRVVIDALICGAVPLMRDWGDPDCIMKNNEHFIALPPRDAGPAAFAKVVDTVCRDDWSSWMVKAREILPLFDCKRGAQIFLDLAEGRGTHRGRRSPTYYREGQEALSGYFSP